MVVLITNAIVELHSDIDDQFIIVITWLEFVAWEMLSKDTWEALLQEHDGPQEVCEQECYFSLSFISL